MAADVSGQPASTLKAIMPKPKTATEIRLREVEAAKRWNGFAVKVWQPYIEQVHKKLGELMAREADEERAQPGNKDSVGETTR